MKKNSPNLYEFGTSKKGTDFAKGVNYEIVRPRNEVVQPDR